MTGTRSSKRVILNKVVEKNKKVKVSGGNNTMALANELYIGLADVMTGIIGNTNTTKDKKGKMIAKVSDEFLRNHARVVKQSVNMTED